MELSAGLGLVLCKRLIGEITDKAPTRAFSWLKEATTAFKFKTEMIESFFLDESESEYYSRF